MLKKRYLGGSVVVVLAALTAVATCVHCGDDNAATTGPGTGDGSGSDGGGAEGGQSHADAPGPSGPFGGERLARGATGCKAIAVDAARNVDGYTSDVYTFHDARCSPRGAALVRNNAADPGGSRGGVLRQYTYKSGATTRTCNGTGVNGWNGFGYVVDHYASTAAESLNTAGTFRTVLSGKHHAIHEFKVRVSPGGPVDATIQWFFATGRSHPIFAITLDSTPAGANTVKADSRAPYGDFAWDSNPAGDVSGIGWGDKYVFRTTGNGPVTLASAWDYTKPNIVPHVIEWSNAANAEMGLVQTQTFERQVAGGDYGEGFLDDKCWRKTSANATGCHDTGETVPSLGLWPFQLNQYELSGGTNSHRVAWGSNFGAVGKTSNSAFGKTFSGFPYFSYSVYVVLGEHTESAVGAQIAVVEQNALATARAIKGTLPVNGPGGVGRADAIAYAVAGYDPTFATWDVQGAANAATVELKAGSAHLDHPVLRVFGYDAPTPPPPHRGGDEDFSAENPYFATVDAATKTLWLTLNGTLTGTATIEIF